MTTQIGIYDHSTGQQLTRDMTKEELANHEAELVQIAADKANKEIQKQEAKDALLQGLGITEAQAIILGLLQSNETSK